MNKSIYPCIWFDHQAGQAASFYCSLFENAQAHQENSIVCHFEL